MADEKKNRFGADPFYCHSPSKEQAEEAIREAIRESKCLDEREESIAGRWHI